MGNQDAGPALDHTLQRAANAQLRVGVHAGSGLVEDEDAGIVGQRAGKVDELLLARRERVASFADWLVKLARQALDEVQHIHIACRLAQPACRNLLIAEANVFSQRAGEKEWILQDDGEMLAQRGQILVAQIHAVEQNLAGGYVVEAHHQTGEGGFAGAGMAHNGDGLTRLDGEGNIFQNPLDAFDGGKIFCFERAWL